MLRATSRFFVAVICTLVFATLSFAAVPITFNYQGYLKDSTSGVPINDKVSITFSLYTKETDEIPFWKETQLVTPFNGIYSVTLGADTVNNPLDPATINDQLYLGITVEPDLEMTPRQVLTSSPFAIRAAVADSVATGGVGNDAISGMIMREKLDLYGVVSKSGDTMTGALTVPGDGSGLRTSGLNQLAIRDGKLGIGTMFPSEQIELTGNLKLSTSTATTGRIMSNTGTILHVTGDRNFFAGSGAGNAIGTGLGNTAVGVDSLTANAAGHTNTAVGFNALAATDAPEPTLGDNNTSVGAFALKDNTTGTGNTAIGSYAGSPLVAGFVPARTGDYNTFIGTESGQGIDAALINATAIGFRAKVSQSNSMVLGSPGVRIGIGTPTPTAELDVVGNARISGTLTADSLNVPANSFIVGTNQLVLSGDKVGIGGAPTGGANLQVYNTSNSGQAGYFEISNTNNVLPALYGKTNGTGQAVFGLNMGTGRAGHFQIANPASSASALVAETNSPTGNAAEILGKMRVTGPITSTVTGTAPFSVASNTEVTNLNANLLNGKLASEIISAASDEVRTPISACGVYISTPGSYYVTQNLLTNGSCIAITTSNVTIDLMGFTLSGDGAGIDIGIDLSEQSNVEIKNGTLTGFYRGVYSINTSDTQHSNRVINIRAIGNKDSGILLDSHNSLIKDCIAANNAYYGMGGNGQGSLYINNIIYNNRVGLLVGAYSSSSVVSENVITGNSEIGTRIAGHSSLIKGNSLSRNGLYNISITSTKNIIENNLSSESEMGIHFTVSGNLYMNNRLVGNTSNYDLSGTTQTDGGGNVSF